MSNQPTPDSIASSGYFEVFASLADAEAGVDAAGIVRRVRCETDGTLVVKRACDGTEVALPFKAGETQDVLIVGIVETGSSGCVPITVHR